MDSTLSNLPCDEIRVKLNGVRPTVSQRRAVKPSPVEVGGGGAGGRGGGAGGR